MSNSIREAIKDILVEEYPERLPLKEFGISDIVEKVTDIVIKQIVDDPRIIKKIVDQTIASLTNKTLEIQIK